MTPTPDKPAGEALKACPRTPTPDMLMAGRKQTFADMTGEHCGPNTERTWQAMWDAFPRTPPPVAPNDG